MCVCVCVSVCERERERETGECVTDDIVENERMNVKSKMREKEREDR